LEREVARESLGRRATEVTRASEAFLERRVILVTRASVASKALVEKLGSTEVQVSGAIQDLSVQLAILVQWGLWETAERRVIPVSRVSVASEVNRVLEEEMARKVRRAKGASKASTGYKDREVRRASKASQARTVKPVRMARRGQ
jgi:hypothetical protein